MDSNYFEKLAKLYDYPYAHGSDRTMSIIAAQRDPFFVQTVAAPNRIVPMHFSCPQTKQLICVCENYKKFNSTQDLFGFQSFANYLDETILRGGGPRFDRRAVHKYLLESERIQHTKTQQREIQTDKLRPRTLRRLAAMLEPLKKICENCQLIVYDYSWRYGWKNNEGNGTVLCQSCYKKFTDGRIQEPSYLNRRFMRDTSQESRQHSAEPPVSKRFNSQQRRPTRKMTVCPGCKRPVETSKTVARDGKSFCGNCTERYKHKENFCRKCGDLFGNEEDVDPFSVGCDSCDNWFHCKCAGLPNLTQKEIEDIKWDCSYCK